MYFKWLMCLSHNPLSQVTSQLTLGAKHNQRQEMFFCLQCKAGYFWPFAIFPRTFSFYGYFALCFPTVRNPVYLSGASRDSPGVGAMEEGLISSWGMNLRFPLLFWPGSRGVYAILNRESGLDLCVVMELCFPLELSKGFPATRQVEFGTWGNFSNSNRITRTPFVLWVDSRLIFELVQGNQA